MKKDKYRRARGGKAKLLKVFCSQCTSYLLTYQKDGDGNLLRCYFNRIVAPEELENYQRIYSDNTNLKDIPNLKCEKCGLIVGAAMVYTDKRLAFRLVKGTYHKEKI